MQALLLFLAIFPSSRVVVGDEELRFPFSDRRVALFFQEKARKLIMANCMPLVTELEKWKCGTKERFELLIKYPPEDFSYGDEVQDDELYFDFCPEF